MTTDPTPHRTERLALGRLPSGTTIQTTVHRYGNRGEGPTVYLQALQHGREVNGLEVLRRVHDRLLEADLQGRVVAVPVANPLSFDHRRYLAPQRLDALNANMNRLWPGDPAGTLLEGMVARLWSVAGEADYVVDLHTGTPAMLSHVRYSPGDPRSRELAASFGLDVILADGPEEPDDAEDARDVEGGAIPEPGRDGPRGKLREIASRAGIPTITPELAHSRAIVEGSVEQGVRGVENVLRAVGVFAEVDAEGDPHADADPVRATDRTRVFARESGMFRAADLAVGDRVSADTAIGEVYDPATYEVLQRVEAGREGTLLTLKRGFAAIEGESLASVVALA